MDRRYVRLDVETRGDVWCVRFRQFQMDEDELYEACNELLSLVKEGCTKLVLTLGPPDPQFLYSIFLARLVSLQRHLRAAGGSLKLAGASRGVRSIFAACRLTPLFDFCADETSAVLEFSAARPARDGA